jgi:hypothetical protein
MGKSFPIEDISEFHQDPLGYSARVFNPPKVSPVPPDARSGQNAGFPSLPNPTSETEER